MFNLDGKPLMIQAKTNWLILFTALGSIVLGVMTVSIVINYDPKKLLVIMFAMCLLTLIFASPFGGICLLAATIPYAGLMQLIPNAFTANKMLALVVACSFFTHALISHKKQLVIYSQSFFHYCLLAVWGIATFPIAVYQREGMDGVLTLPLLCGMTYLIAVILKTDQKLRIFCFVSAISAALIGVYTFFWGLDSLTRGGYSVRLAAGTNENVLAHALAVCMLISMFAFRKGRVLSNSLLVILNVFILYAIALTGSRGTWVALLISIVATPLLVPGVQLKKRLSFLIVGGALISLAAYGMTQNVSGPYERIFERVYEINTDLEATGGRLEYIWPAYIESFKERPLIGFGYGYKSGPFSASHNNILFVATHFGLIGLTIYLLMWYFLVRESLRHTDPWIRLLLIGLLVFMFFSGMTHDTLNLKSNALAMGIICYFISRHGRINDAHGEK